MFCGVWCVPVFVLQTTFLVEESIFFHVFAVTVVFETLGTCLQ